MTTPGGLPDPLTQEVASILRSRIARFNIDQDALATALDVPVDELRQAVGGRAPITLGLLDKLCGALDIGLNDLIAEADEEVGLRPSPEAADFAPAWRVYD